MDRLAIALLLLYFIEVTSFFAIGTLVILRQKTPVYISFAVFAYLAGTWQGFQFLSRLASDNHDLAVAFLRISVFVSGIMAASFLNFALTSSNRKPRKLLYFAAGGLVGLLSFFSDSLRGININHLGIGVPKLDFWYGLVLLFGAFCVAYGVLSIFQHHQNTPDGNERRGDSIVLVSIGIVGVIVLFFSFSTSDFSNSIIGKHILPSATLALALALFYAIYRGLFDIHFFVVRALAYIVTALGVSIGFIAPIVLLFGHFLGYGYSDGGFPAVVVAALVSFYFLVYVRKLFDKLTNRIFFRGFYNPQDVIDQLSSTLATTIDIDVLVKKSTEILSDAIKPGYVLLLLHKTTIAPEKDFLAILSKINFSEKNVIIVDDLSEFNSLKSRKLRDKKAAVVVKLRTTHDEIGFMVLGYKESGQPYTNRDVRLLNTYARELAIAIQNSLRFEEIQKFNITLQEEVKRQTSQLRKANKRLRLLDQTKDDFISMASHQMRTPLTSVKGYLSMVLEGDAGKLNEKEKKLLNQAFVSSQRMVYLISDLLNVSRLKTGKFVIENTRTNLAQIVQDEMEQLVDTAKARNLKLNYQKPESFPSLMLDDTKMRQVVMNFMDNAVHYTPSGGKIDVELKDTGKAIEYTVTDNGIGVPKAEQHNIFSKFFRANNAKKARPDGTGLGLYMAQKVVIAQGGSIIFRSEEGKGSTFGFRIEKSKLQSPNAKGQEPPQTEGTDTKPAPAEAKS